MISGILTVCVLINMLLTFSNAESQSMACIWITKNGHTEKKCAHKTDQDGNVAGAAAGSNGESGMVAAGAGTANDFNTDYQQIGSGGANDGFDFQLNSGMNGGAGSYAGAGFPMMPQFNNPGTNGGGAESYAGAGYSFNPMMVQDFPFKFVQDFFKRRNP